MSLTFHPELLDPLIEVVQAVAARWQAVIDASGVPLFVWQVDFTSPFFEDHENYLTQVVNADHPMFAHWVGPVPFTFPTTMLPVMDYIGKQFSEASINFFSGYDQTFREYVSGNALQFLKKKLQDLKRELGLRGKHANYIQQWNEIRRVQDVLQKWAAAPEFVTCGLSNAVDSNPAAKDALRRALTFKQTQDVASAYDRLPVSYEGFKVTNAGDAAVLFIQRVMSQISQPYFRYPALSSPDDVLDTRELFSLANNGRGVPPVVAGFPNPMRRAELAASLQAMLADMLALARQRDTFERKARQQRRSLLLQGALDKRVDSYAVSAATAATDRAVAARVQSATTARRASDKHANLYEKQAEDELKRLQTHLDTLGAVSSALAAWTPDQPLPPLLFTPGVQALLQPEHDIHKPISGLGSLAFPVAPSSPALHPPPLAAAFAAAAPFDDSDEDGAPSGPQKRRRR